MKTTYAKFDVTNPQHRVILSDALLLAQNETLENASLYLKEHFQVAPLKALGSLFRFNLGCELSNEQELYVKAYHQAEQTERANVGLDDYPLDFNPELYDL